MSYQSLICQMGSGPMDLFLCKNGKKKKHVEVLD